MLDRLDDRWVQRFANGLRALRRTGLRARRSARDPRRHPRGVLGLLVIVVLAAAVATAVINPFASAPTAASHPGRGSHAAAPTPSTPVAAYVGPRPGEPVATYLAEAQQRMSTLGAADPSQRRYAVVSFAAGQTAAQAGSLVGGTRPVRAFLQAPLPGGAGPVRAVAVQSLVVDLPAVLAKLRAALTASATEVRNAAQAAAASNPAVAAQAQLLLGQAQAYGNEAAALWDGCACVIGVVVDGTPRSLQQLATHDGVRAVDVAPAGVPLSGLETAPLPPSATRTAPSTGPVSGP